MFLFFPTSLSEHPFPNSYTTKIFVTLLSTSFLALTKKIMPPFTYLRQLQRRLTQLSNWLNWNIKPIGLIGKPNFPSLQLVYQAGDAIYFFLLVTNFSLIFSALVSLEQNHFPSGEVETQLHEIHRLIGLAKFKCAYQTEDIILPSTVVAVSIICCIP